MVQDVLQELEQLKHMIDRELDALVKKVRQINKIADEVLGVLETQYGVR